MSSPVMTPPAETEKDGSRPRSRPALSPSRAADFKQCPLLYRFRAVDRLPEEPTRAQVRGTVVHAALEDLFALPASDRTREAVATLVQPAWDRVAEESPDRTAIVPESELATFLAEVGRLVDNYFQLEDPASFEPEHCEDRLEIELDGAVPLRGIVDRIDVAATGEVRVVDYKTGRAPGPDFERSALFQMKFYALMLLRSRGVVPTQLKLLYLADRETLTYRPDRTELDLFERTLVAVWQAIRTAGEDGSFEPSPSRLCRFCDHQAVCPAFGGTPPPYPGWPEATAQDRAVQEIVQ